MRAGRQLAGFVAIALLIAVAAATAWLQEPRGYLDASAPADRFSAARAFTTIEEIAQRPHPVGTPEHDRVRDHLAGKLRELGLETEIRTGIGRWPSAFAGDDLGIGQVQNIVARMRGTDSTGTVYLAAHYDSVPSGPGANDDGSGVAVILETVRALRDSGGLRNDVVVLLTDGEEPGLLGAEAFVAAGDYDRDHSVVVNHDARGASGPPLLWRLTHPDGDLIRAVAATVPHPNSDSASTLVAGDATSSTTDFVAFEPGGLRVLDWAYAGHSAYYHNRLDDPAHVGLPTLQQLGENTLAQAREFGQRDLRAPAGDDRPAFFPLPFGTLVVVPIQVILLLAGIAVIATVTVIAQARRAGETNVRRVLLAALTSLPITPLAVAAAYGFWELVQAVRPAYKVSGIDPYRPELFQAAILVVAAAVPLAWYAFARKVFGQSAAPIGLLTGTTLIAVGCAALVPAAACLVVIPAATAALGVALTFRTPPRWRLVVLTVFLLPTAVFLGQLAWSGVQAGLATAAFLGAPVVALLGGLLLLPSAHSWPQRRAWPVPLVAVALVALLAAAGTMVDRVDEEHPRLTQLSYALDADSHDAQWLSALAPDDWTRRFVIGTTPAAPWAALMPSAVSIGPAPAEALAAPTAEIVSDKTDSGQRTLVLRLRSPRGATGIGLHWSIPIDSLRVAGRDMDPLPAKGFRFFAPPAEGIEVVLVAPAGPLTLRLADYTWLPDSHLDAYRNPPQDFYFRQDSAAVVFTTVSMR